MESQDKHSFEEQWLGAFNDASIEPPDDLWQNIEHELDKDKRRAGFFFFLSPRYVASGVAAMLLIVFGLGYLMNNSTEDSGTKVQRHKEGSELATKTERLEGGSDTQDKKLATKAQRHEEGSELATTAKRLENTNDIPNQQKYNTEKNIDNNTLVASNYKRVKSSKLPSEIIGKTDNNTLVADNNLGTNNTLFTDNQQVTATNTTIDLPSNSLAVAQATSVAFSVEPLQAKDMNPYNNRFVSNRRRIFYEYSDEPTEVIAKNESNTWMGINSGLSPFNSNLKINNFETTAKTMALASGNNYTISSTNKGQGNIAVQDPDTKPAEVAQELPNNQPINKFKTGRAIGFGFNLGKQLAKRWAIESGIKYLYGASTLTSNVYSLNNTSGGVNSFVENYLSNTKSDNAVISVAEDIQSSYEYVSIPLQLNYQIPINKLFKIEFLGGFSSDFLMNNTFKSKNNSIQENKYTSGNSLYKILNISGLGSMRVAYKLGSHWQTNLGLTAQQILTSGINSSSTSLKPRMIGLGYGVNYRF